MTLFKITIEYTNKIDDYLVKKYVVAKDIKKAAEEYPNAIKIENISNSVVVIQEEKIPPKESRFLLKKKLRKQKNLIIELALNGMINQGLTPPWIS